MLTRRSSWALLGAGLAFGLLLGGGAGAYLDQAYPEYVPVIALPGSRAAIDSATYQQAVRVIESHYYGSLDSKKLTQGSVKGLVDGLGDPYSQFQTQQQFEQRQQDLSGRQSGVIGITLNFNGDYPVITSILPASPAQRAGLLARDTVVSIDGQDAKGVTAQKASTLIRGTVGTSVKLGIRRDSSTFDVTVARETFTSPTVVSRRLDGNVLYLRVYQFGINTATDFRSQLAAGLPGAKGVVLDLRENPGGLVDAAASVLSAFIPSGELFSVEDHGGHKDVRSSSGDHPAPAIPLYVLVDANSASASEIVAGSLQERGRAKLVGVKTFGKGSVQEDYRLQDGSDIHLTIQHWYLPDGRSVINNALQPDYEAALGAPADMYDVASPSVGYAGDTQLNRALDLIAAR